MIMDIKLSEKLSKIPQIIKNFNNADYVPIGQVELTLDSIFDKWDTTNFTFNMHFINNRFLIVANILLHVYIDNIHITRSGSVSWWATGEEIGIDSDYSGIAKSYAINNAAKSLGTVFGRELNDRVQYAEFAGKSTSITSPTEISKNFYQNKIKL